MKHNHVQLALEYQNWIDKLKLLGVAKTVLEKPSRNFMLK